MSDSTSGDRYEINNSFNSATQLTLTDGYVDVDNLSIHEAGDVDFFKFTISGDEIVRLDTSGSEGGDTVMSLYDSSMSQIASNDDNGYNCYSTIVETLDSGTYYVKISSYDSVLSNYSLSVETVSVEKDSYEDNNSKSSAKTLNFDEDEYGFYADGLTIHAVDDVDYFKITVGADQAGLFVPYIYDLNGNELDYELIDGSGNVIYGSDEKFYSEIGIFDAGTYYLKVSSDGVCEEYSIAIDLHDYIKLDDTLSESGDYISITENNAEVFNFYKFTVVNPGVVEWNTSSENVYWFNVFNSDGEGLSIYDYQLLAAGDYYVVVESELFSAYDCEIRMAYIEDDLGDLVKNQNVTVSFGIESDDQLYYEFTLSESGLITLDAMQNYEMNYIVTGENGVCFYIPSYMRTFRLGAGNYVIAADSYAGGEYEFSLSYTTDDPDAYEGETGNDSVETAYDLGDLTKVGKIELNDISIDHYSDNDYFKFILSEDGYVSLSVDTVEGDYDARFDLYVDENNHEGEYEEGGWWSEYIGGYEYQLSNKYFLKAGTYYVNVHSEECIDNYTLTASYSAESTADKYEENDTVDTAASIGALAGNNLRIDKLTLHHSSDVDHYKFSLNAEKVIWVQTIADGNLAAYCPNLYDGEGGWFSDVEGYPYRKLSAGEYIIGVAGSYLGTPENYSLLIKALEETDKTVSGTGNKNGIFTTGDVALSAGAKLNTEENSAIYIVNANILNDGEYYWDSDKPNAVDADVVTLNNNTVVSNIKASGGFAIFFDSGYSEQIVGKMVFNGPKVDISVDGGSRYATAIYGNNLELVFDEDVRNSANVSISAAAGRACAIGASKYDGDISFLNISGSFGGTMTAIGTDGVRNGESSYGGATGISAGYMNVGNDLAGTIVAWDKNHVGGDYFNSYGIDVGSLTVGVSDIDDSTIDGEISGVIAALQSHDDFEAVAAGNFDGDYYYNVVGIYADEITAVVSGTIFAGNVARDTDLDEFLDKLANSSEAVNKAFLKESSDHEYFYAVYAGTNSDIRFTETADIWGNIHVDINSFISVSSQTEIYGDLTYYIGDEENVYNTLCIDLDRITLNETISGEISGVTSIYIDAAEARNGKYMINNSYDYDLANDFCVSFGDDETLDLSDADIVDDGYLFTFANGMEILLDNDGLVLTVSNSQYIEPDYENPGKVAGVAAEINKNTAALTWNTATDNIGVVKYEVRYGTDSSLSGDGMEVYDTQISIENLDAGQYFCQVRAFDAFGNAGEWSNVYSFTVTSVAPALVKPQEPLTADVIVEVTAGDKVFELGIAKEAAQNGVAILQARGGFDCNIKSAEESSNTVASASKDAASGVPASVMLEAEEDGVLDIFFAEVSGTWSSNYVARHNGIFGGWEGTGDEVELAGKNNITDFFYGSNDDNILVLTDDANGDALFVDDIFSATPGTQFNAKSRLAKLQEVCAGAGDDIIDMTSKNMEYTGEGVVIRGGDGNDVIWANSGSNKLFGDAGRDNIIGAAGNELIVGGSGDDILNGGGGNDIFAFGENDGVDTVTQIAGGSVTLWFESAEVTREGNVFTYGDNCRVTVADGIEVEFITGGADLDGVFVDFNSFKEQAFAGSTSETIYKKGNLA